MATLRETVFNIVEKHSPITKNEVKAVVSKMFKNPQDQKAIERLYDEAMDTTTGLVMRFRDIAPDNNVVQLNAEKKGIIKVGLISDTHFGSKHHVQDKLEETVDKMLNDGVTHFLCAGDMLEGWEVYAGQAADVLYNTQEDQIAEAIKLLPRLPKDKKYYWISGNHDLIWLKRNAGFDPLIAVAQERSDVEYLGKYSAYVWLSDKNCVQLLHPMSGGGMSVGYGAQKVIDNLSPGRRPTILNLGHWHSPLSMLYKDVNVEMNASFMGPTNLSIRNGWANVVGGRILTLELNKHGEIGVYGRRDILFSQKDLKSLPRRKV